MMKQGNITMLRYISSSRRLQSTLKGPELSSSPSDPDPNPLLFNFGSYSNNNNTPTVPHSLRTRHSVTPSLPNKPSNDLELLERSIQHTNKVSSNLTNYNYKITYLPPGFGSNQQIKINSELEKELQEILSSFNAPIDFALGYGSGVFEQAGYLGKKPQIDLIFGCYDPLKFHEVNLRKNPYHYSGMRYFGSHAIAKLQEVAAGVYFNPFATISGHEVKYGVVSMDRLLRDLALWDTFYLAGRLQKPVKFLKNNLNVLYWNQVNLRNAATLGKYITLEKNGGKFDEFEFYKEITALSYLGDIRYTLGGEDPHKVTNIVTKNFQFFREYYKPIYEDVVVRNNDYLPRGFTLDNSVKLLTEKISGTSSTQAAKGILTAGVVKSLKYAWHKKMKAWKGKWAKRTHTQ